MKPVSDWLRIAPSLPEPKVYYLSHDHLSFWMEVVGWAWQVGDCYNPKTWTESFWSGWPWFALHDTGKCCCFLHEVLVWSSKRQPEKRCKADYGACGHENTMFTLQEHQGVSTENWSLKEGQYWEMATWRTFPAGRATEQWQKAGPLKDIVRDIQVLMVTAA